MEDFERWLIDELETQTLTDELKDEILERVRVLYEDTYAEGYSEAKDNMLNYLEDM
jgi:hypothetical protein